MYQLQRNRPSKPTERASSQVSGGVAIERYRRRDDRRSPRKAMAYPQRRHAIRQRFGQPDPDRQRRRGQRRPRPARQRRVRSRQLQRRKHQLPGEGQTFTSCSCSLEEHRAAHGAPSRRSQSNGIIERLQAVFIRRLQNSRPFWEITALKRRIPKGPYPNQRFSVFQYGLMTKPFAPASGLPLIRSAF
jgi:hypothetical protein